MFLSIQVQFTDSHSNPSNKMCQIPTIHNSSTSIEDINANINLDFEENSPFQERVMSKTFQRLDKSFFKNLRNWGTS